jgi:hypothetical protein
MLQTIVSTFPYFWPTYGCALIGILYFISARPGTAIAQRIVGSAYAPVAGALFLAATFTDPEHWSPRGIPLFLVTQILPLVLLIISVRKYAVPRSVHFVLVPLALVCWGWQVFWGQLGVL